MQTYKAREVLQITTRSAIDSELLGAPPIYIIFHLHSFSNQVTDLELQDQLCTRAISKRPYLQTERGVIQGWCSERIPVLT